MINYLGQYIKNMAELTANIRLLLRKDVLFQWTESYEANFQKLKDSISSNACVMYYSSSKPVILQVDASVRSRGCLLQTLLLKMKPYDIVLKYIPSSKVPVALSRVSPSGRTKIKGLEVTIHEITHV